VCTDFPEIRNRKYQKNRQAGRKYKALINLAYRQFTDHKIGCKVEEKSDKQRKKPFTPFRKLKAFCKVSKIKQEHQDNRNYKSEQENG